MADIVLSASRLVVRQADRTIVDEASFDAARGEIVGLMGASGSGKTTILRAIAGLVPFASGQITVDGVSLEPRTLPRGRVRRDLYQRVGMVFQFHHLFDHLTALHNVWLAPVHVLGHSRADAERRALDLLGQVGVAARADALPRELSGGEAQRVAIARALAVGPRVLLMDEPTASLDAARRGELAATLRRLASGGCTLVVATHDEEFVKACANRVLVTRAGTIEPVRSRTEPSH